MRNADYESAMSELQKIPNVGPATAEDLIRLGIHSLTDLAGKDYEKLYEKLCRMDGLRYDPCVKDVFRAAIVIADGGPARPWWEYSRLRKSSAARPRSSKLPGKS